MQGKEAQKDWFLFCNNSSNNNNNKKISNPHPLSIPTLHDGQNPSKSQGLDDENGTTPDEIESRSGFVGGIV